MQALQRTLGILLLVVAGLGRLHAADVIVDDPWVAEPPPGARVAGAFMGLENASAQARTLVGVNSPSAERVEIHRTVFKEGMARMLPQDKLIIPAHAKITLKPGDYHLMLIRPQPLRIGDRVELNLELDDGTHIPVIAAVRERPRTGHHHH